MVHDLQGCMCMRSVHAQLKSITVAKRHQCGTACALIAAPVGMFRCNASAMVSLVVLQHLVVPATLLQGLLKSPSMPQRQPVAKRPLHAEYVMGLGHTEDGSPGQRT